MDDANFFYKNNRLQQLRGFCYAVQFENISHAAKYLNSTHATVSLQIKSLERDLGVELFKREGPKITVTPTGKKLYNMAIPSIQGFHDLIGEFNKDFRRNSDAEIHIGANDASLTYILPGVLSEFCKERPETDVTLHRFEFEEGMDKLLYEEVEVFACPRRFSETPPKGVEYIPLFHYRPVLVTCPGHPLAGKEGLTIEDITQYDLTLPPRHLVALPGLHDFFPEKERKKKLRVDFNNWEVTHGYIATGLVVEVSSDIIVTGDKVVATSLDHIFPDVDYGFFVVEGVKHSKNLEVLIESARRYNKNQRDQKDATRVSSSTK